MSRAIAPTTEPPVDGETTREARERRERNARARKWWRAHLSERCANCGQTRNNVIHEDDREHAPEGLAYYRDVPFCEFRLATDGG